MRRLHLVSTRTGAERVLLLGFVAVRLAGLVQATIGVAMRSLTTTRTPLAVVCLVGVAVESIFVIAWLFRRGRAVASPRLLAADGGIGILALAFAVINATPEERLMPWSVGLFAVTFSTAVLVGLSGRTLRSVLLGSAMMAVFYLAVVAVPIWPNRVPLAAAITNACAYPKFAIVLWIFARIMRDLADLADRARDRAAQLERDRGRAKVLDMLPFLNPELISGTDEGARSALAQTLRAKYRQMRAFVDGTADGAAASKIDEPRSQP